MDFGQAPEIQTMYSVPFPVSDIRTRMRQEFERHRYVNKLGVVDVLLMQNNAEYQVCLPLLAKRAISVTEASGETPGDRQEQYSDTFHVGNDELLETNYTRHVILRV